MQVTGAQVVNTSLSFISFALSPTPASLTGITFFEKSTLQQLSRDERVYFLQVLKAVKKDFYVDDLLSGSKSIEDDKQLEPGLIALLERGGLNLKWASNYPEARIDISGQAFAHRNISI